MTTLRERLDRIREGFEKQVPPEVLKVFHGATGALKASGAEAAALGEGAQAPDFALPGANGETVARADLLARGPLVLAFFRGHW